MSKSATELGMTIGIVIAWLALGSLMAFPVKWCWNYTAPHILGAPEITWGHAFCIWFLVGLLKPILQCHHGKSE